MEERPRPDADPHQALREISLELHFLAGALADIALPSGPDAAAAVSARQVAALIAARARRAAALPVPSADPNWTLLLRLLEAHLRHRPLSAESGADRRALRALALLGIARETGGAWALTPETAAALQHQLAAERRALTGR